MSSDFPSMRISAHLLTVGTLLMSTAWTIVLTQTTVSVKGKKVQFDRDSLAVLTETVSIPRLTSVSACMWMKTTHTGAWTVISYAVARRDDEIRLSGLSDATLKLKIKDSSPSVVDHQLNDGQWHHLCMSWMGKKLAPVSSTKPG
ncbi:neuronal pentraxin-1-like [Saccoglossus kowalevskii]